MGLQPLCPGLQHTGDQSQFGLGPAVEGGLQDQIGRIGQALPQDKTSLRQAQQLLALVLGVWRLGGQALAGRALMTSERVGFSMLSRVCRSR